MATVCNIYCKTESSRTYNTRYIVERKTASKDTIDTQEGAIVKAVGVDCLPMAIYWYYHM